MLSNIHNCSLCFLLASFLLCFLQLSELLSVSCSFTLFSITSDLCSAVCDYILCNLLLCSRQSHPIFGSLAMLSSVACPVLCALSLFSAFSSCSLQSLSLTLVFCFVLCILSLFCGSYLVLCSLLLCSLLYFLHSLSMFSAFSPCSLQSLALFSVAESLTFSLFFVCLFVCFNSYCYLL